MYVVSYNIMPYVNQDHKFETFFLPDRFVNRVYELGTHSLITLSARNTRKKSNTERTNPKGSRMGKLIACPGHLPPICPKYRPNWEGAN